MRNFLCIILFAMIPALTFAQSENPRKVAEKMYQRAQGFQYEVENNSAADSLRYFRSVVDAIDYTLRSDEADRTPDKSGTVKTKYDKGNQKRLLSIRPRLIDAALYLLAHNHKQDGEYALKLYLKASKSPLLKDENSTDESAVAAFYLAQTELEAHNYKAADRYADIAMSDDDIAQDAVEIKAQCMHDQMVNHEDSTKYLAVLAELYKTEPSNPTYFAWLMQFYSHRNPNFSIENFIDQQLQKDATSCIPWILKGEVAMHAKRWEEALDAYMHADELDHKRIPVVYNIGICSMNFAMESERQQGGKSSDDNKEKAKNLYVQARTYLERVKTMDPRRDKVDWVTPLYEVYKILGDKIKAEELMPLVKKK